MGCVRPYMYGVCEAIHVWPCALTHPHQHAPSHTYICREHKREELMQKRRDKENLTLEGGRIGVRRHRHMDLCKQML